MSIPDAFSALHAVNLAEVMTLTFHIFGTAVAMLKAPSFLTAVLHAWSNELNHGIPHAHSALTALILALLGALFWAVTLIIAVHAGFALILAELVVDVLWVALFHARHILHVVTFILEEEIYLCIATLIGWV